MRHHRLQGLLGCAVAAAGVVHGATIFPSHDIIRVEVAPRPGTSVPLPIATTSVRGAATATPRGRGYGQIPLPSSQPETVTGESVKPISTGDAGGGAVRRADDAPARPAPRRSAGGRREAVIAPPAGAPTPKGGMPDAVVYDDPGAVQFSAEAGWASHHLWRGVDLGQFTSYNHQRPLAGLPPGTSPTILPRQDSDVYFFGVNATVNGWYFGVKYIESLDDGFNPYFAPLVTTTDSYQEVVISANYSHMLIDEWLQATFGADFYIYPNGEFWGVDHQGMLYANFSMPRYRWAQPFLNTFYNVATDSSGNGLASVPNNLRGASGSDLVEGWGVEIGVSGGDTLVQNGNVSFGLTYSVSSIYKQEYAFESSGFSHLVLTLGAPVQIGDSLSITPSVSFVEARSDIQDRPGTPVGSGRLASAWNEPGWVGSVKVSWAF